MEKSLLATLLLFLMGCIGACSDKNDANLPISPGDFEALHRLSQSEEVLDGHQLANAYCGVCHLKPAPGLLDSTTWVKNVLPAMGRRMGLVFPEEKGGKVSYPSTLQKPLISTANWEKIKDYYQEASPNTLSPPKQNDSIEMGIPGFEVVVPEFGLKRPSLTTLLYFDKNSGNLFLGERGNKLLVIRPDINLILDSVDTQSTPSDIRVENKTIDLLEMGIMDPSDSAIGSWNSYKKEGLPASTSKLKTLNRPVNFEFGDLNGDGLEDLVICNFGNQLGSLAWYEKTADGYLEHSLKKAPGARRVILQDMTGNGLLDLVVLMAQAKEGIFIFYNQGNGTFHESSILRFSPVFGASDFELVDFDKDGHLDILLTNGDNADLSQVFKPYHGVHIFQNNGHNQFQEKWFFPMYGASKALAADFDSDGWVDIAAISFFPDYNQTPRQDFIYFKGKDAWRFSPYVLEMPLKARWLTLETGDFDQNGYLDLFMGSFMLNQLNSPSWEAGYFNEPWAPFVILKNISGN